MVTTDEPLVEDVMVRVYPNPFTSQLTINTNNQEELTITIYNNLSQPIIKMGIEKTGFINTAHFPSGIYYYELKDVKRLIKSGILLKN